MCFIFLLLLNVMGFQEIGTWAVTFLEKALDSSIFIEPTASRAIFTPIEWF